MQMQMMGNFVPCNTLSFSSETGRVRWDLDHLYELRHAGPVLVARHPVHLVHDEDLPDPRRPLHVYSAAASRCASQQGKKEGERRPLSVAKKSMEVLAVLGARNSRMVVALRVSEALSSRTARPRDLAMRCAVVVFPIPGGPLSSAAFLSAPSAEFHGAFFVAPQEDTPEAAKGGDERIPQPGPW